ncbi:MAG: subtype I-B CRISPR-associated endonuclease Cas1 [Candidatus Altiarchaeales archaeon WOR_SM1_86-2]|nr:MAG: subtype I-B CRISPR-associated endonuclease Cas1 [Candidatus Altiarchaeales archaeon WOR_SM1_86-2]ODS37849.1 MAG: subtype I-B CRISPR-associated endonuclease Cas1 [Candidatus Altiarchaeales archaeon WOR_SM1_79]
MKRDYYILKSGRLKRKQNTIYFEKDGEKKPMPVNGISSIFVLGELDVNTKLLVFLAQNKIPVHFFNYYGYYSGTYYPREYLNSGFLVVKQVEHYLDKERRMRIAREFVDTAIHNILMNLAHYKKQNKDVGGEIEKIKTERKNVGGTDNILELMAVEGRVRDTYYGCFNKILRKGFEFEKRVKRPPDNMINALISFGNSLIYGNTLTEIYHTQLNPTISYLHEPGERRFSLSLDLSEVFKPIIADRVIFKLINNQVIKPEHFQEELNACYLNDDGRRIFLSEHDEKLKTTIQHKDLKRKVSYQRLMRLEAYKLVKHLIGEKDYAGFKAWW